MFTILVCDINLELVFDVNMLRRIRKLKDLGLSFADSTFEAIKNSKPIEVVNQITETTQKVVEYFQSQDYEEDLDEIIEVLYILNPAKRPGFEDYITLENRLKAKSKFVRYQTLMFLVAAGSTGFEIGSYFSNERIGLIIGTTTGLLLVTFIAGRIIVRRISTDVIGREIRAYN